MGALREGVGNGEFAGWLGGGFTGVWVHGFAGGWVRRWVGGGFGAVLWGWRGWFTQDSWVRSGRETGCFSVLCNFFPVGYGLVSCLGPLLGLESMLSRLFLVAWMGFPEV